MVDADIVEAVAAPVAEGGADFLDGGGAGELEAEELWGWCCLADLDVEEAGEEVGGS